MSKVRYLEVKFGDNDFGSYVQESLRRLWKWVHENNAHCIAAKAGQHFSTRSVPKMFVELHRVGALKVMIDRLCALERLAGDVEYKTRGLYFLEVDWAEKIASEPVGDDGYLLCDLKFHTNKKFSKQWRNGEHAYLDLTTGQVATF